KASFTVRKVSYNVGVERTFLLHSPRIDKIQVISKGRVRRARLFYLRPLRGKASRIQSELVSPEAQVQEPPKEEAKTENNGAANGAPEEAKQDAAGQPAA